MKIPKFKPVVGVIVLGIVLFVTIGFSSKRQNKKHINEVVVKIVNQGNNYFIDNLEVLDLINAENTDYVLGLRVEQLNLKELEKRVKKHPFVREVEVFKDLKGNLLVDVIQTRPIARVYDPKGPDYYIGEQGQVLPVTAKHTARVPLVEMKDKQILNAKNLMDTEDGRKLFDMMTFIDQNKFWNAQVAHLFVDKDFNASMLTQVSRQVVDFGEMTELDKKFRKLKVFYQTILPGEGWNSYDSVSIKYTKQIVAD